MPRPPAAARAILEGWKVRQKATVAEVEALLGDMGYESFEEDGFVTWLGGGPVWTFPAAGGNLPASRVYNLATLMLSYLFELEGE